MSAPVPAGSDAITVTLYDQSSLPTPLPAGSPQPTAAPFNALATAMVQQNIRPNVANAVNLVLGGIPVTLTIPAVTRLVNPVVRSATATGRQFEVAVTATDADSNVIMTDPYASPITVRVFGPAGVVSPSSATLVSPTSGGAAFTYSGGYFGDPMVAIATAGNASMTAQIFAANTVQCSYSSSDTIFANTQAVSPNSPVWDNKEFHITFGIGGGRLQHATLDTGSTGIQVGLDALASADMSQVIGPGQPFDITLFPSGIRNTGHYYLAPVTIADTNYVPLGTTIPMEIEVVEQSCNASGACTSTRGTGGPSYVGIGFDREGNSASVMGLPLENPLLQLTNVVMANPAPMHPGYVLSTGRMSIGLNAADTAHFPTAGFQQLTPNPTAPGDWNGANGCIAFNGAPYQCGQILVDIGQAAMLLNRFSYPTPVTNIAIAAPSNVSPALAYSFGFPSPSGTPPAPTPSVPHTDFGVQFLNSISSNSSNFANLGINALAAADYLYDARCGRVGFAPPS